MNDSILRALSLTVLAASITVAASGCKGKDAGTTADTTAASAMKMPDSAARAASAPAAPMLTDANIAGLVDEVNVADSTLAAAALPKLTSADARKFARLMMGEHHALHVKGLQLEKAQNLTPEIPAADPFKAAVGAEQTALGALAKGAAYDSTYITHEVGIHQAVIEWQGANTPQNPALRDYMKNAKSVIQKHLDDALAAQSKLGGGPMS